MPETARPQEVSRPTPGLAPRRRLDRLAWALGGLALGWAAQELFARDELWPGMLLYAVAIPIFAIQMARHLPDKEHSSQTSSSLMAWQRATGAWGRLGVAAIAAAAILSGVSWYLFGLSSSGAAAWGVYLASLLQFGLGAWLVDERPIRAQAGQPTQLGFSPGAFVRRIDPWLVAILLLALFMRLFHIFSLPFGTWFDEATTGLEARRIVQDPAFRPAFSVAMNQVAHHLTMFALSLRLLGDSTAALRAVSVMFGLGAVLAAYLFGRELGGRRWGLLMAFLVATMRWHLNFSRIAMNGIDTPFFIFLTLFLALRLVKGKPGPVRSAAWLGLAVGLGLSFYTAYRLFALAAGLFGLAALISLRRTRKQVGPYRADPGPAHPDESPPAPASPATSANDRRASHRFSTSLGVFLLAVWLAAMPAIQYAYRNPHAFWGRAQHVSIFRNRDESSLARALGKNVQKHLLMFNYRGDNNGRHNLPGAPTLDRLSAILFALGVGLAIVRRTRIDLLFLLLLLTGLLGGILTLDFEAPQSLRSIAALPATIYFVAVSLDALWLELRRAVGAGPPRYSLGLVALGLGVIAFSNAYTYFGPQAHDPRVWMDFSTAETLVGKKMAELGPDPVYYLSPFFHDHATIRFLAPAESANDVRKVMPLPDPFPAREPPERPVVYFIHPDEEWAFDLARQLYPAAQFETLPPDSEYPLAALAVYLDPAQVASVQGLEERYWAGQGWDGIPQHLARAPVVEVAWPEGAPLGLPFVAEWSGTLYAPWYGDYALGVDAPGRVELTLNGEKWAGSGRLEVKQNLAQGNHELRLRAAGGYGRVRLWWQPPDQAEAGVPTWALYSPPVGRHGLLGKYYASPDWQGAPAMQRVDPILNQYFHLTPLPRPYSVEWTGVLDVPESGVYSLGLRAVDRAQLYLDGQLVVDAQVPDEYTEGVVELPAGPHDIRVTFQDLTGRSRIHLWWARPNGEKEIIPSLFLRPDRASQPARPPLIAPPPPDLPPLELVWLASWGGPGDGPGQLMEPRDVATIGKTVFVADTGNQRVQEWERDGTFRRAWGGPEEPFLEPLALGVDAQSRLLVLDSLTGWVYRFDADGRPIDRFGGPAIQVYHPRGMTVTPEDTLIIADTGGGRLLFSDADGEIWRPVGAHGEAPGQLGEPTDVAAGPSGTYYVTEAFNQRVQQVDSAGHSLGQWSIPPSIARDGPHVALAPDGSLLVTAPEQGAIQRYSSDGRLLNQWTQAGATPLCRPVGIYLDISARTLYVTDTACHQVHVFKLE